MGRAIPKKKSKITSSGSEAAGGAGESDISAERGMTSATLKREYDDDDENYSDPEDCEDDPTEFCIGSEMSSLLKNFQNDVKKNMSAKRKRLETLTSQSATNCKSKVDAILENQRKERQVLHNEYTKQMNSLFGQWESDIAKVKENEDKLNAVLQQQIKLIAQIRVVQTQRFKSLKQLQEQYCKSMDEVEVAHGQQKARVTSDLKSELSRLQSKILKDTQTQEMAAMKQNFHSMLFK